MSDALQASMAGLIKQAYRPWAGLTELLGAFLQAAVRATRSTEGRLCLNQVGAGGGRPEGGLLVVESNTSQPLLEPSFDKECPICLAYYERRQCDPLMAHDVRSEAHCRRLTLRSGSSLAVAIRYQRAVIGVMAVASNRTGQYSTAHLETTQSCP